MALYKFILIDPKHLAEALQNGLTAAQKRYATELWLYNRQLEAAQVWAKQFQGRLEKVFELMESDFEKQRRVFGRAPSWDADRGGFTFYHTPSKKLLHLLRTKSKLNLTQGVWPAKGRIELPTAPFTPEEKPFDGSAFWNTAISINQQHMQLSMMPLSLDEAEVYGVKYAKDEIKTSSVKPLLIGEYRR
jgi:hypothetical protein